MKMNSEEHWEKIEYDETLVKNALGLAKRDIKMSLITKIMTGHFRLHIMQCYKQAEH